MRATACRRRRRREAQARHHFERLGPHFLQPFARGLPVVLVLDVVRGRADEDVVVRRRDDEDGALHPVEIKKSAAPKREMASAFRMLDPAPQPRGAGAIVCMAGETGAVSSEALVLPAWAI